MLVTKTIAGLYNGISQQPATMRLDSQCEDLQNSMPSLVDGNYKRPPVEHIAVLPSVAGHNSLLHTIDRDSLEKYLVLFNWSSTEPIEVYDLQGNKKQVYYGHLSDQLVFAEDSGVKAYLECTTGVPKTSIKAVTVADYTMVVNTEQTVTKDATEVIEQRRNVALIHIKQAVEQTVYTATLNGVACSFTSRKPTTADPYTKDTTSSIAYGLATQLRTAFPELQVWQKGALLMLYFWDYRDFSLSMTDGYGDQASKAIQNKVSTYTDLPAQCFGADITQLNDTPYEFANVTGTERWYVQLAGGGDPRLVEPEYLQIGTTRYADRGPYDDLERGEWAWYVTPAGYWTVWFRMPDGSDPNASSTPVCWVKNNGPDMKIEITWNDQHNNSDPYYVKFEDGSWIETRAYGMQNKFRASTMPHRLVRMSNGDFVFADCNWSERLVGDEHSAPTPSFVGAKIDNVFFYKNRLGFLSKDNIIFSRAGSFFNFWTATALEVLDDDPIDVSVATLEVTHLREALPFNKNLFIRADLHQFILPGSDTPLTPKTITVDMSTRYETIPNSKSCAVGSNVYFSCPNGPNSAIREYFVQPDSLIDEATDVTVHVPRLIPSGNTTIVGCSPMDLLLVHNDSDPYNLYLYKYFWTGSEKPQSAWNPWKIGRWIIGFTIIETTVYLLTHYDSNTIALQCIKLYEEVSEGLTFKVRLDGLFPTVGTYDPAANRTTWTLPYWDSSAEYRVVHGTTGSKIRAEKVRANQMEGVGDYTGWQVWIGRLYTSVFEPSGWYLKDSKDNAMVSGRLQHRTMTVTFTDTGFFQVTVTPNKREAKTQSWLAKQPAINTLDRSEMASGSYRFTVLGEAMGKTRIQITNGSHYPSKFQSITHEGFYTTRSRAL